MASSQEVPRNSTTFAAPVSPGNWFQAYQEKAETGGVFAQLEVGEMYEQGRGVNKDFAKAARWYRKAAEHENLSGANLQFASFAADHLGRLFFDGRGVPLDYLQAKEWYLTAIDLDRRAGFDNDEAEFKLGEMYAAGSGVEQDYYQACWHLSLAAFDKLPPDPAVEARDDVAHHLTAEQFFEIQNKVRKTHPSSQQAMTYFLNTRVKARKGDAEAQKRVGLAYASGRYVPLDYAQAYFWLGLAAATKALKPTETVPEDKLSKVIGEKLTSEQLTEMKRQIPVLRHSPRDLPNSNIEFCCPPPSISEIRTNAADGDAQAEFDLGSLYFHGSYGVIQNFVEADKWLRKAAAQGSEDAQGLLRQLYANAPKHGRGIHQDWAEAYFWFLLEAKARDNRLAGLIGSATASTATTPDELDAAIYKDQDAKIQHDIESHLTADEIATDVRRAAEWAAAHSSNSEASPEGSRN